MKKHLALLLALFVLTPCGAETTKPKILFFTKSSGWEHEVISWQKGRPSFAEKQLLDLAQKNQWEMVFSKDGSLFSPAYLATFDVLMFYTTGDLTQAGTDKHPPMTLAGKQAIFDFVRQGKGFVGIHCTSDTFHSDDDKPGNPERYRNQGEKVDPFIQFLGGEFIHHGAQQNALNYVVNAKFPGFETIPTSFTLFEEWYSLKNFNSDIHVLTFIEPKAMKGEMYHRPPYPTSWARREGKGRVWYTSLGHREDIWTNPLFQQMLVGGTRFALGELPGDTTPNLSTVTPEAHVNPPFPGTKK